MNFIQILTLTILIYSCNSKFQNGTKQLVNSDSTQQLGKSINKLIQINYNSGDVVTSGLLDKDGRLWFGTSRHGVYCYDGTTFTHFTSKDGLCNNEIWSIIEDKTGTLWFGTSDGLCTYNGKAFSHIPVPRYRHDGSKTVMALLQDKDDSIWIGTWGGGAYRYDGKSFESFLQETGRLQSEGHYNNAVRSIIQDHKGNIWFGSLTHGGISCYDGENFTNYSEKDGLCDDMVFTSFEDSKGNIWIGVIEDGDLCCYDGHSFIHYTQSDGSCFNFVSCFYEDKSGKIWFGSETENGICIYDGELFIPFSVEGSDQLSPARFILEDAKGHIWIGGRFGSLWRYNGSSLEDFTQAKNN